MSPSEMEFNDEMSLKININDNLSKLTTTIAKVANASG